MAAKSSSHWPLTLTNGIAAIFSLALPLAIVRLLTPDQVGRYKIFFLYILLSPAFYFTAGLGNGLYHWAGKYPESKPEIRESWTFLVGLTLFLSLAGFILVQPLSTLLKMPIFDLQVFFAAAPLTIISAFLEDLMVARGRIWMGSWCSSGFNVLRAVSVIPVAYWTRSLDAVLWVFLAGMALRVVVDVGFLFSSGELRFVFLKPASMRVLHYAVPVSMGAVAALALQNVDQLILSARLSPAHFALYSIGCLTVPPLIIFESSVTRVLIPKLAAAYAAGQRQEAAALFKEGILELYRFLLPAVIGLFLFSDAIIRILFTDRYADASVYLRVYAFSYLALSLPADLIARARGDGAWIMKFSIFFAVFCIVTTWFSAGAWGAMGALTAIVGCQWLMRLYSLTYDRKYLAVPFSDFLPLKDMFLQLMLAAVAVAVSLAMRPLFATSRSWFFVTGPIFTVIYFAGLYAISLRRHWASPGPVRVLELIQTLSFGGAERMVYSLSRALNRHPSFKVWVATYEHPVDQPSLVPKFGAEGIPLVQWQKGDRFSVQTILRLVRLAFSERIHVLHAHGVGPLIYGSFAKLLSFGRVRLVVTLHTLLDIESESKERLYTKLFLRFADRIVAVSEGVKEGHIGIGIPAQRIDVILNGVAFPKAIAHESNTKDVALRKKLCPGLPDAFYTARWLLCLARLHPDKGQGVVLDLWSALSPDTRQQSALFIVGQETEQGYMAALQKRRSTLPDAERVVFVGPSEDPENWIQLSDVFISGSRHEGMPLAPLEAAGSGLPSLLSDIEGHRFLQSWAHFFDPKRPETGALKLFEILETLMHDRENVFEKQWNAAAPLRQQWDASAMAASYAETFESA